MKDYDREQVEAAVADLDRPSAAPQQRKSAVYRLVRGNAGIARAKLAGVLEKERDSSVRAEAAKYLAILGDRGGLDAQVEVLRRGARDEGAFLAERLLGSRGGSGDSAAIAPIVKSTAASLLADRKLSPSPEERAFLKYGVIALARLGRLEDRELITDVVARLRSADFAEALGYVGGTRSRTLLWEIQQEIALPNPRCDQRGLAVPVLLALSRTGDDTATAMVKRILEGELGPRGTANGKDTLCGDREQAFQLLRPRDAALLAESVLTVAGQEVEGPWTFAAWRALGVMQPRSLAGRMLSLATSRRPHWKEVSRDLLNKAVIAANPDLNRQFWSFFEVAEVPDMSGERALVEAGAGHLLFSGTEPWTGD